MPGLSRPRPPGARVRQAGARPRGLRKVTHHDVQVGLGLGRERLVEALEHPATRRLVESRNQERGGVPDAAEMPEHTDAEQLACHQRDDQVLAAKPSAEWDATWGKGFMKPDQFLTIVHSGMTKAPAPKTSSSCVLPMAE